MNISPDTSNQINDAADGAAMRLEFLNFSEAATEENITLALQAARRLTGGNHPDSDLIICVIAALIEEAETL